MRISVGRVSVSVSDKAIQNNPSKSDFVKNFSKKLSATGLSEDKLKEVLTSMYETVNSGQSDAKKEIDASV